MRRNASPKSNEQRGKPPAPGVSVAALLERVQEGFDYVIIDTSSASTDVSVKMGLLSRRCMLITTQDPVSVRSGQSLLHALKEAGMEPERCRLLRCIMM